MKRQLEGFLIGLGLSLIFMGLLVLFSGCGGNDHFIGTPPEQYVPQSVTVYPGPEPVLTPTITSTATPVNHPVPTVTPTPVPTSAGHDGSSSHGHADSDKGKGQDK